MEKSLTKLQARNVFFGGSLFFLVVFVILVAHSHVYIVNTSTDSTTLSESVIEGKRIWEEHSCINCHTLLGEGAYFAPELGNVWVRYGGVDNAEGARAAIKAWMMAMPTGVKGRRQMPQFNLSDQELDNLVDFLEWTSRIDTQGWPPNDAG
jgi:nitric oxide reductase subunit C